jgi:Secretion system C-terminal sorting domain
MKTVTKILQVLMVFLLLAPAFQSSAQNTVTVGNGTISCQYPYTTYWGGGRSQFIYTAAQLTAAGASAGTITSMGFNIISNDPEVMNLFNIRFANTALSTISSWQTGLQTCYSGTYAVTGTGWQMITLTTPFAWNGTSNLILEVCYSNGGSYTYYSFLNGTTAPTGQLYPYWMDNSGGCIYTGSPYTGYTGLPNLRIVYTPLVLGNLTGTVKNCNTNLNIVGASVSCGGVGPVLTNGSGVYTLNGIPSGPQTITATYTGYTPYSNPVTVVGNTTTTFNFCMFPLPGILNGIVTNAANGNPVVGARVTWGTYFTYSVAAGAYSMNVYAAGPFALGASKEGFNTFSQAGVTATVPSPPNTTVNIAMAEDTPPPSSPFTAALNAGQTAVNLNWGLPVDDMVLIYDDGIQDNFAIWATGGGLNMNAMKFTPISYPAIVKKFYVNIGTAANYPSGSNAFSPVQMAIYSEVGGLPGVQLSAPTTITPTVYGWSEFNFTAPVTIASGNFFIVMIQLGNSTASPGLGIDTTSQQLRSFSKFGTTPWIPGPGNYMIRAVVNGSGGPLIMDAQSGAQITASAVPGLIYQYAPATVTGVEGSPKVFSEMGYNPDNLLGYQVWRMLQGQGGNPALWTSLGTPTNTSFVDNSWQSLPCGPYQWVVKAQYTFNRWSNATLSNVIGKCWTCNVTVNIALSCDSANALGATVHFQNLDVVDTSYTYVMTASGTHTFTNFWKGNYTLTVTKFDYTTYIQTPISIMGDMTINVMLLQIKTPPTGLHVVDSTLFANWNPPMLQMILFNEPFTGGFGPNAWVTDAGSHWVIAAGGNPGNCAEWPYGPEVYNYSDALTSKVLTGNNSTFLKLRYDIYLSNFGTTTLEQLAVEVYDGTTWHNVKNYDNHTGASIPWTTETVDITPFAPSAGFKVRFRAYGADSYWINYWMVDNVQTIAQTDPHDPCIIGYNFYLNNIISGYIPAPDTFYNIPPANVNFGTFYHACVNAIYGSGYSTQSCFDFNSKFLCPPNTLTVTPLECTAYLSWLKPNCGGCTLATYQFENGTIDNGFSAYPGNELFGNWFPVTPATTTGVIKSFDCYFSSSAGLTTAQSCILYVYNAAHTIIGQSAPFMNTGGVYPAGTWVNVPVADIPYTGGFYGMVDYSTTATPYKNWFLCQYIAPTGYPNGIAWDLVNGTWTLLGTEDPTIPIVTFIERANVCANGKDKDAPITTIDPSPMQPSTNALQHSNTTVRLSDHVNIEVGQANNPPTFTPDAPEAAPVLLGYRIFRNDLLINTVNNPNTLFYYDYNLNPGTYSYKVDALYNISPLGPPQYKPNSQPAGPVSVTLACGYPLPFFEPWTLGQFGYQQWTFAPSQGNWTMNTAIGDPAPCADFSWQPVITNYDLSLVSPTIDASAWTCANIFCDIDVKLVDRNATGTEKLDIDVYVGGAWQNKAQLSDSGSYDWTLKHINITGVMGKGFKVRFRAHGPNSGNIMHWYVDNIHLYGVCSPPTSLAGHQNQFTTTLTWHSPECPKSCSLKQYMYDSGIADNAYSYGTAASLIQIGNFFNLGAGTSGVIKSFDMWFSSNSSTSAQSCIVYLYKADQTTIFGQSPSFMNEGAPWTSGTWVNVPCPDIPYTGPFYAMVDYTVTSTPNKNFFGADQSTVQPGFPLGMGFANLNGTWSSAASIWGTPMATFLQRANVCENGKDKDAPVTTIDPFSLPTYKNLPRQADAISTGTITDHSNVTVPPPPAITPNSPAGSQMMGYNVYRTKDDSINGSFIMVNNGFVHDSTFQEIHAPTTHLGSSWKYYVTVVFRDSLNPSNILCEPTSDTILITFPVVGINDLTNSSITLYPNPANDLVYIVSTNDIKTIEVLNYIGQTVYTNNDVNQKKAQLNVTSFKAGVYFVKITTTNGIKTTKITVTH